MFLDLGVKIHKTATILLPQSITLLLNSILNELPNKGSEYGIYLKGTLDEETMTMTVSEEYMIPKQEVTNVTIDFKEPPPSTDWNVVIHRHPNGVRNFSATDDTSINEEFDASLLFIPPMDYPAAIINYRVRPDLVIQLRADVKVISGQERVDVSMINQKRPIPTRAPNTSRLKLKRQPRDKLTPGTGLFADYGNTDLEKQIALDQELDIASEELADAFDEDEIALQQMALEDEDALLDELEDQDLEDEGACPLTSHLTKPQG